MTCRTDQHPGGGIETRDCCCGTARQTLDGFQPGERRFFWSKGQFSLVDVAVAMSAITGPVDFQCAVWTGTQASVRQVERLVNSGRIRDARWILCDSQRQMNEDRLHRIIQAFGADNVRATRLHAKVMTLSNDDWSVVVQTSANMTLNRSVEQYDVTDSDALLEHVTKLFDEVWDTVPPLNEEPPFDRDGAQIEEEHQSLCLGNHQPSNSLLDIAPIGIDDGL